MSVPYDAALELSHLAGVMLSEPDATSALNRICRVSVAVIPPCDGASITMRRDGTQSASASSDPWSESLDTMQFVEQEGPCLDCLREASVMRVRDLAEDSRFPSYGPKAAAAGARSVLSLPLAADGRTVGALNLYSRTSDAFDAEVLALGELLAAHASLAVQAATAYFSSRDLAEQMRDAMASRAVIDQAKGVLMAQRGCTADEAFRALVDLSQRGNRKLRDVAQALVDQTAGG